MIELRAGVDYPVEPSSWPNWEVPVRVAEDIVLFRRARGRNDSWQIIGGFSTAYNGPLDLRGLGSIILRAMRSADHARATSDPQRMAWLLTAKCPGCGKDVGWYETDGHVITAEVCDAHHVKSPTPEWMYYGTGSIWMQARVTTCPLSKNRKTGRAPWFDAPKYIDESQSQGRINRDRTMFGCSPLESTYVTLAQAKEYMDSWDQARYDDRLAVWAAHHLPINHKEDSVKVFEAIVLKLNDKSEPESVTNAGFVLARTAQEAREQTLVDYASANSLKGKDLTGLQVRVREFQSAA